MTKRNSKGFSLIEILIYLAIFAVVSIVVINSFITVLSSFKRTRSDRDLLESGLTSVERISREIRQAKSIDMTNSTCSGSFCILQLNSTDINGVDKIVKFMVSSGFLKIYENGVDQGSLTSENISISSLIFKNIVTTNSKAVKIEMTIIDSNSDKTANFYNTIILRGGY